MPSQIPLYCSHSYRPADRDLNVHFWRLCHDAGFTFTVDPKSTVLSTFSLELMMARSTGFIAMVTHRPETQFYECSPFIVYEYGLAFQARKPRLVLRDKNVSPNYFKVGDTIDIEFDRNALQRSEDELISKLREFHELTSRQLKGHRGGKVGVALPVGERRDAAERVVEMTGDEPVNLWKFADDPFALALNAERCDYVIADLDNPAAIPIVDFLQGRAIPLLKIARRGTDTELPLRLLSTAPLRAVAASDEMVTYWDEPDGLGFTLHSEVTRAKVGRQEFDSFEAGYRYFRSAGRQELPVFVSNASSTHDFAQRLTEALSLENVPFFHYQFNNTIATGQQWADQLASKVEASGVFVMLIDSGYWKSEWCRREYEYAVRLAETSRLTILPFFLEGVDDGSDLPVQGRELRGMPAGERVRTIVSVLDELFVAAEEVPASIATSNEPVEAGTLPVDIAIVTILPEEYRAVLAQLTNMRSVTGTDQHLNNHAWVVGEIHAPKYQASFRVVLTLSAKGNNAALIAAKNTIPVWEPHYVLVVGVAGGLKQVKLGDVVVANRIYAYEYGKIDHGFKPRHDQDSPTDSSIAGAATTLPVLHEMWFSESAELRSLAPAIHVEPVASGDKVVDDRSDAFFKAVLDSRPKAVAVEMEGAGVAAAIQDARELQRPVGFGMIRGISDLPPAGGSRPGETAGHSAQTEIRDSMKQLAATAAATCAAQLIRHSWPRPPRDRPQS